ncbi:hypothetical protein [Ponticaulis sp.]|uniref:hypothetical protein n=1 Tax=Ponticaulis sp. TaxID=2020902 RepID=UPI0026084A7C|nr:hypothetical protein [Ponticaulis sp.]MDF1679172.1 hypothetical protein [Ponticaulis sp.]
MFVDVKLSSVAALLFCLTGCADADSTSSSETSPIPATETSTYSVATIDYGVDGDYDAAVGQLVASFSEAIEEIDVSAIAHMDFGSETHPTIMAAFRHGCEWSNPWMRNAFETASAQNADLGLFSSSCVDFE